MAINREIKSISHDEHSYVAFENRSPRRVALFWHNYEGKLVRYAVIEPGAVHRMNTYVTHPWSATDSNSGDKQLIDGQYVFYPRSQDQVDDVRYDRIYIDLPGD